MKLISPYRENVKWYRGSFHIHSNFSGCGWHSIEELALAYRDYDFMSVTDHDRVTTETEELKGKVLLRGFEVSGQNHMLLVNETMNIKSDYTNDYSVEAYSALAKEVVDNGGFSVINHPCRLSGQHWSFEDIMASTSILGLEVFSGDGINVAEDVGFELWDRVLSNGKKFWGLGNDDFHHWGQERRVWNVVNARSLDTKGILEAIRGGDFYISSGYGFDSIKCSENTITYNLKSDKPQFVNAHKYLTLYGKDGKVLAEKTGKFMNFTYTVKGDEGYVRAEVYVQGGYGGFAQPIFIEN